MYFPWYIIQVDSRKLWNRTTTVSGAGVTGALFINFSVSNISDFIKKSLLNPLNHIHIWQCHHSKAAQTPVMNVRRTR